MLLRPLFVRPGTSHSTTFLHRTRPFIVAFGFSLPFLTPSRSITQYDISPGATSPLPPSSYSYSRDAKTPLTKDGRTLNPAAVRQISLGSILGLGAGLLLSAFSRTLTLLLGLGIVVWQYAAQKGYNILPVDRVQKYVQGVNMRSAVYDNVAFKVSFGLMFALASFGEF
jgi:uncharacterized membrane protein (Fun14 family)